jgi:RHS repeat-associated protein
MYACLSKNASSVEVRYFHNNYMGLPRLITDDLGAVVWSGQFKPFGELYDENAQVSNWVRFIGQYLDEDSGFYYNYFRDYDASLGRYLQSDPIGLAAGVNTYTYVLNDPVNNVDPFGLKIGYGNNVTPDDIATINALLEIISGIDSNAAAMIDNIINSDKTVTFTTKSGEDNHVSYPEGRDACEAKWNFNMSEVDNPAGHTIIPVMVHEMAHAHDYVHGVDRGSYFPVENLLKGYPNAREKYADDVMNSFVDNANINGWGFTKRLEYPTK